jgi:hypothetical protein
MVKNPVKDQLPSIAGLSFFPENRKTELQHKNEADRLSVTTTPGISSSLAHRPPPVKSGAFCQESQQIVFTEHHRSIGLPWRWNLFKAIFPHVPSLLVCAHKKLIYLSDE